MTLLAIADDDFQIGKSNQASPDVLISLGDLDDAAIARAIEHYHPCTTLAVRGNHDSNAPFPSGIIDLHLSLHVINGIRFGGFAGSWRYKPCGHHLYDQEEVSHLLRNFPAVDVFVAHNSPFGVHQRDSGVHQGFHGFLDYIHRAKPKLFLHGHQHLDRTTTLGETSVVGVFGERLMQLS
jgi:Icc-related predicted phosphoesterase